VDSEAPVAFLNRIVATNARGFSSGIEKWREARAIVASRQTQFLVMHDAPNPSCAPRRKPGVDRAWLANRDWSRYSAKLLHLLPRGAVAHFLHYGQIFSHCLHAPATCVRAFHQALNAY